MLAEAPPPPLRRRVDDLGQALALFLLAGSGLLLAAQRLRRGTTEELLLGIAVLALTAVPAGLPAAVAAALSSAVRRLRRAGIETRTPATAETLGGIDVLLTDTSGTLTCGELTVRELLLEDEPLQVTGRASRRRGRSFAAASVRSRIGGRRSGSRCVSAPSALPRRCTGRARAPEIYQLRDGFLLSKIPVSTQVGDRAALYLGPRLASQNTILGRLRAFGFALDAFMI